jgi:hypothetical protein
MEVFAWQIGIILGIGLASVLFGKGGWILASAAAAIWTFVMIFTSWLMILQFVTVFAGFVWGLSIVESPNQEANKSSAWGIVIVGIIGVIWAVDHFKKQDSQPQATVESAAPVIQSQIAPAPAAPQLPRHVDRVDKLIAEMEQAFPELVPSGLLFDQRASDSVINRWKELQKSGMGEYDALLRTRQEYIDYRARAGRGKVVSEIDSRGHVFIHN